MIPNTSWHLPDVSVSTIHSPSPRKGHNPTPCLLPNQFRLPRTPLSVSFTIKTLPLKWVSRRYPVISTDNTASSSCLLSPSWSAEECWKWPARIKIINLVKFRSSRVSSRRQEALPRLCFAPCRDPNYATLHRVSKCVCIEQQLSNADDRAWACELSSPIKQNTKWIKTLTFIWPLSTFIPCLRLPREMIKWGDLSIGVSSLVLWPLRRINRT